MKTTFVASLLLLAAVQGLPHGNHKQQKHRQQKHRQPHLSTDFTCNEPFMIPASYRDALGNRFALCFSDPRWNHRHLIWYVQELNGSFKAVGAAHKTQAGQYEGGVFPVEEPSAGSGIHASPVKVRVSFDKTSGLIEMKPDSRDGIPVRWHIQPEGFAAGTLQVPSSCGPYLQQMKKGDYLAPLTGAEPGATVCLLPKTKSHARAFISWGRSRTVEAVEKASSTSAHRNHALELDGQWDQDDVGEGVRFLSVGFVAEDRGLSIDICERGEGSAPKRCEMSRLVGHNRKTFVLNDGQARSTGLANLNDNGTKEKRPTKHSKHEEHGKKQLKRKNLPESFDDDIFGPEEPIDNHHHSRHNHKPHLHPNAQKHRRNGDEVKELRKDISKLKRDLRSILEHAGRPKHDHEDFEEHKLKRHSHKQQACHSHKQQACNVKHGQAHHHKEKHSRDPEHKKERRTYGTRHREEAEHSCDNKKKAEVKHHHKDEACSCHRHKHEAKSCRHKERHHENEAKSHHRHKEETVYRRKTESCSDGRPKKVEAKKCHIYPLVDDDDRPRSNLIDDAESGVKYIGRSTQDMVEGVGSGAGRVVGRSLSATGNVIDYGVDGVSNAVNQGVDTAGNVIDYGVNGVGNTIQRGARFTSDTAGNAVQTGANAIGNTAQAGLKVTTSTTSGFVKQFGKMIHDDIVQPQLERKRLLQYRAARNAQSQQSFQQQPRQQLSNQGPVPQPLLNQIQQPIGNQGPLQQHMPMTASWSGLNPSPVVAASNAPLGPVGPFLSGSSAPKHNYYKRQAEDYLN